MRNLAAIALLSLMSLSCTAFATPAGDEVSAEFEYGSLQLHFEQSMQTWQNTRADIVRLTPAMATTCHWQGDTKLQCEFEEDTAPANATRYRIHLAPGLKTQSGQVLSAQTLEAETARPTISADITGWTAGRPDITITSNVQTTTGDIAAALHIKLDGKPIQPVLRVLPTRGAWDKEGRRYALVLPELAVAEAALTVAVAPGLKTSEGPLRGTQDVTLLSAIVNELFQLRGAACAGRAKALSGAPMNGQLRLDCMPGETVRLLFSQPLQDDAREAWIQSWPATAKWRRVGMEESWRYRTHRNDQPRRAPAYWVDLQVEGANTELTLPLPGDLRSKHENAGLKSVMLHIRTGDSRPALRATHARTLLVDGDASPMLAEAINAAPVSIDVHGVGVKFRSETLTAPAQRSNQPTVIVSEVATRALAEGGWTTWSPKNDRDKPSSQSTLQFAAPAFDLFAVAGRREVMAWANDWNDGRPVADADVELLWMDGADATPRLIARGSTQQDGTVLLTLPEAMQVEGQRNGNTYPMWLLRAASGRRAHASRAVLPLGGAQAYGINLGRATEQKLWGVSDRPLYHAGETVRYHLWLRDDTGGRLLRPRRIAPLALRLSRVGYEETILGWSATPDAKGGISGELILPAHLPDDTYCLGTGEDYELEGSCFYVGTYRAQDLWAEASMDDRVLRDGDTLQFDINAGYYSGGPAAGVPIGPVTALLRGLPLDEAYPRYADYHFVDTTPAWSSIRIAGVEELKLMADSEGRAHGALPVVFDKDDLEGAEKVPAFGRLRLTAEVKLNDRESTVASEVSTRYSRFARFVGLRLQPSWLDSATPASMEAIVIDAEGREIVDASIAIEVRYLPGFKDDKQDAAAPMIKQCVLRSRQLADCTFPRAKTGRYQIIARSADAAPAELTRMIWVEGDTWRAVSAQTELELLQAPAKRGDAARILLKQPNHRAQALFVFVANDRILGHQVATVTGTAQSFELATSAEWPWQMHIRAYVRASGEAEPSEDGLRTPVKVTSDDVELSWAEAGKVDAPLALSFAVAVAKPGETVRIVLRNDSPRSRTVVLAVVDDALRALADNLLPYFDPHGERWLGSEDGYPRLSITSFGDWNDQPWRWWLPWPDQLTENRGEQPLRCLAMQGAATAAACRNTNSPAAAARVADDVVRVGQGAINPIDVTSIESTSILTAEQIAGVPVSRDVTNVALLAPGTVLAAPPPMSNVAPAPAAPEDSQSLDTVTVVGTGAIDPAGIFEEGKPRIDDLRPREERSSLRALARVRTQFADTALWQPDIRLEPGESRSVELKLPDNLTRWRAVAWSSDADDDFAMAEATLEVGLPVEVRLQTPVRIYPGDRARLAANVRQTGDGAAEVAAGLRVEGGADGDAALDHAQALPLAARGQGSFGAEIAPQRTGTLLATASAQTPAGQDAVAAPIDVASPFISARKVQAGWLGGAALQLELPALPVGATDAQFRFSVLRGGSSLVERWSEDLRDYEHRCWEQILSRAVAAALAIERGAITHWPDAQAVVSEALDNAAVFQNVEGDFRYFAETSAFDHQRNDEPQAQVALTAYTVQAFALLRELGHPVPVSTESKARKFLKGVSPDEDEVDNFDEVAFAMAANTENAAAELDGMWHHWDALSLPAKLAATRALAYGGHAMAAPAVTRLLQAAPLRGSARVLTLPQRLDRWMSSDLREQCAFIELLRDYPQLAGSDVRRALIAGLTDLYAGGVEAVDTQAGAVCLVALRKAEPTSEAPVAVDVRIGAQTTQLRLPAGQDRVQWTIAAPDVGTLLINPEPGSGASVSFVAQLDYREDARQAQASAVGFALDRRHAVLRDGQWTPVAGNMIREGDWIRVSLVISTSAPRYFVAVTDDLPGGLRPTDLSLSSVAGLDIEAVSDPGSRWFATRKLDPRSPRFYAEYLPAGRHEIHYFARIGNSGEYLAAPALAELMYGSATRARTAAARLNIKARQEKP